MQQDTKFWTLEIEEAFQVLKTGRGGLTSDEAQKRAKEYGANRLENKHRKGPLTVLAAQFASPLIFMLLFAGAATFYLGEHIEAGVIILAVVINILFGFYQEYKAENTIEKLASYIKNTARVLRDGSLKEVDAEMLVPGDIISIEYGSRIPADARVFDSQELKVDEAILTGESLPAEKQSQLITQDSVSDRTNYVFAGTYAVSGVGLAVVTQTGSSTEIGRIAESVVSTKRVLTPVQNAVRQISWYIFLIALVVVIGVFFLGISRGESILDMLVLSSAVAVGAVPEALPITLTVILSVGVLAISRKGGLIRKLSAAETLGSTTLVMTDKTGTLTYADLSMDAVYTVETLLKLENNTALLSKESLNELQKSILAKALLNTSGIVEKIGDDPKKWIYTGNAFDRVLLKSVYQFGIPVAETKADLVVPFNSTNKYSIAKDGNRLSILGAPDILINNSLLPADQKELLLVRLHELSTQGKRLIALGEKVYDSDNWSIAGVSLLGIFTFSDALREDAASSIAFIQAQGISVKIITGDLPGTARFIAGQVGISVADNEFLTGDQVRSLSDDDLKKILPTIKLFARVTPEDKLRIGNLYRSLGEIVAMTGDGVNDAPALKATDIGISLGSGSDVAKSAADMILLDNNFKTITETITEGHTIRSNIQKVFVYLMSNSLDEVFVIAGSLIAGIALPLNALQIIWVNVLTGTLPALAFAYERNASSGKKEKSIFSFKVKFLALGIGTLSSLLMFGLYYALTMYIADAELARSVFFACFATYVLSVAYSFRDIDKPLFSYNPFSNIRLNIATIVGFVLVGLTIYIPFMQKIFSTVSIPARYLWIVIVWSILNIAVVEIAKAILGKIGKKKA